METSQKSEGLIGIVINQDFNRVLLLKRSDSKMYGNIYAPVAAGPYGADENFRQKALEETKAETGLEATLLKELPPFQYQTESGLTNIHPFLLQANDSDVVVLNDEHTEYRWVNRTDLTNSEYDPRVSQGITELLEALK